MPADRLLIVECGASHVASVVLEAGPAGMTPASGREIPFTAEPGDDRAWTAAIAAAAARIVAEERLPLRECTLVVPGHLVLTKFVKTPAVAREQRHRVAQFEAAQAIPQPLESMAWGYAEMADDGVDLELMLAAVKIEAMDALCTAVEASGLRVVCVVPIGLVLVRAAVAVRDRAEPGLLWADIGARTTHLVFAGPDRVFLRTLALGGHAITQAAADAARWDFPTAESRTLAWSTRAEAAGADDRGAFIPATEDFVARLHLEITRSRLGSARQHGIPAPARLRLTGRGATLSGLPAALAAKLELPVELAADAALSRSRLLQLWAAGPSDTMNLLAPGRRASPADGRRRARWGMAVVGLLLALLPPLIHLHLKAARLDAAAATLEREIAPLRHLAQDNARRLAELQAVKARREALRRLAENRADWLRFLADLQERLATVGDAWIDRLAPAAAGSPTETGAPGPLRLALAGRLLDPTVERAGGAEPATRVNALLAGLAASPFVQAIEHEHYDSGEAGILRFEVTLLVKPGSGL